MNLLTFIVSAIISIGFLSELLLPEGGGIGGCCPTTGGLGLNLKLFICSIKSVQESEGGGGTADCCTGGGGGAGGDTALLTEHLTVMATALPAAVLTLFSAVLANLALYRTAIINQKG